MPKKLFAWAAGVCALMLTSGVYQPADAKHAGSSGGSKGSFSMGHSYRLGAPYKSAYAKPAYAKTTHAFKHKHAFRHHKRIIVVGYNDYAYGSECYWLKRKARAAATGGTATTPAWRDTEPRRVVAGLLVPHRVAQPAPQPL